MSIVYYYFEGGGPELHHDKQCCSGVGKGKVSLS